MEEEGQAREKEPRMANGKEESVIYSGIRDHVLHQIKNIDLDGSFGTKIDAIARHILWIREHDPGAKSIVFSQYRDFLDVLARAFAQFRIDFTGIDRKDGIEKFQNDPSVCTRMGDMEGQRLILSNRRSASSFMQRPALLAST